MVEMLLYLNRQTGYKTGHYYLNILVDYSSTDAAQKICIYALENGHLWIDDSLSLVKTYELLGEKHCVTLVMLKRYNLMGDWYWTAGTLIVTYILHTVKWVKLDNDPVTQPIYNGGEFDKNWNLIIGNK